MKTTIELPDGDFRKAKALAAARGTTLKQLFTDALQEKLRRCARESADRGPEPPWMAAFGALSDLSSEHRRVNAAIEEEFGTLAPEQVSAPILEELKRIRKRDGGNLGELVTELVADGLRMRLTGPVDHEFGWFSQPMHARVALDDKEAVSAILDDDPS